MPRRSLENAYLVEHYRPDIEAAQSGTSIQEQLQDLERHCAPARFVGSVIVPQDEAFLVVIAADSEHEVRDAYLRAGVSFDRMSTAIAHFTPLPPSRPGPADVDVRPIGRRTTTPPHAELT